ncbi:hypothetical protein DCAR_0933503 [Daucus carota subsp. sativus]|uniref:Uncharacterized protein n=1 Tax=Daucus carota subsp. sativus TaxID=79200 RepID=A0AAF1BDH0_DAUCS|nr:PREDICTED: uncharacterized protein LOC108202018 isoform X1 [Daucus carota subsp. sativus]XP_017225869.1 PREDICTED: uncharacterized protein LOC108202018 isoform X2 [Daucus carota subsp. sativus]WOH13988.1 hypothetical protein DCAR_0933503 [Daucus carota subsp. sativus]
MAINFRRSFRDSVNLVDRSSRWTKEKRDQFVDCVTLWFVMDKGEILSKCEKNVAVCLAVIVQLAIIVINSFLLGDAEVLPRWKATWIARMSIFAIFFLTLKICVEMKRFKLTWRNNKEVRVFIITHVLQFLIPLLYLSLAYAYLLGVDTTSHHMRSDWKLSASSIKTWIHVLGSLLSFIGALYYWTPDDHQCIIAFATNVDNSSVAENVSHVVVHVDAGNQAVGDANAESHPVCVENQPAGDTAFEVAINMNVDQTVGAADATCEVAVKIPVDQVNLEMVAQNNAESEPVGVENAGTNLEAVGQTNMKYQAAADSSVAAVQSNLENQPAAYAKLDVVMLINSENQPVEHADVEGVVRKDAEEQHFADAKLDVVMENKPANANLVHVP